MKESVLNNLLENGKIEQICSEYGEQGYSLEEGKQAILFADWNDFDKHPNFMAWLEENYEIEWSDEWIVDYETDKCYRTTGDSYGWEQSFRINENGELITPDSDIEDWIDFCKIDYDTDKNATPNVLPSFVDTDELIDTGFELINDDLESGWYNRNDDPTEIAESLLEQGYIAVIFKLSGVGQFSVNFEVYALK